MAAFDFAKIDEFPQSKIWYGGDQMKKPFLKIALVMNLKGKPFKFFFRKLAELQPLSEMAVFE